MFYLLLITIFVFLFETCVQLRGLATVLLRKCIASSEDSLYPKLSAECKQFLKSELLEALRNDPSPQNRSKLVYTISSFVSGLLEKSK